MTITCREVTIWIWTCPNCGYENEESLNPITDTGELACVQCTFKSKDFEVE